MKRKHTDFNLKDGCLKRIKGEIYYVGPVKVLLAITLLTSSAVIFYLLFITAISFNTFTVY